jgi:hypothetical protein
LRASDYGKPRASRVPPAGTADEVARLMRFYEAARKGGGTSIRESSKSWRPVLIQSEPSCIGGISGTRALLSADLELASRLSFFLWRYGSRPGITGLSRSRAVLTKPGVPSV